MLSRSDLTFLRSKAAQILISGDENVGINLMLKYSSLLGKRITTLLLGEDVLYDEFDGDGDDQSSKTASDNLDFESDENSKADNMDVSSSTATGNAVLRSPSNEESDEILLSLLLNEAHGILRGSPKLNDLTLSVSTIRPLDARLRFRLGVGLAKLGLFELSLQHVSLSATPWEAPLYQLRAKLVFPSIHNSIRSVSISVGNFERQIESILSYQGTNIGKSLLMIPICNSLSELSLALQALPLLHLAGFAAPRNNIFVGHSPVALPVLLSEVLIFMCPPRDIDQDNLTHHSILMSTTSSNNIPIPKFGDSGDILSDHHEFDAMNTNNHQYHTNDFTSSHLKSRINKILRVGIVSGSFDGISGRIVIGLLESISSDLRKTILLTAMCFPTPRDTQTDRVGALFDHHINISPHDKNQAIERVLQANLDFIIFSDALFDSRVFALAHERLGRYQFTLWGWGGTVAIPTIDFFIMPSILWTKCKCMIDSSHREMTNDDLSSGGNFVLPQELFFEQVDYIFV